MAMMNPFGGRFSQYFPSPLGSFNRGQMAGMDIKRQREQDDMASKERGLAKLQAASGSAKDMDAHVRDVDDLLAAGETDLATIKIAQGVGRWEQYPYTPDMAKKRGAEEAGYAQVESSTMDVIGKLPKDVWTDQSLYDKTLAEINEVITAGGLPPERGGKLLDRFHGKGEAYRKVGADVLTQEGKELTNIDKKLDEFKGLLRPWREQMTIGGGYSAQDFDELPKYRLAVLEGMEAIRVHGMSADEAFRNVQLQFSNDPTMSDYLGGYTGETDDATDEIIAPVMGAKPPWDPSREVVGRRGGMPPDDATMASRVPQMIKAPDDVQTADTPGGTSVTEQIAIDPRSIDPTGESPPSGIQPLQTKYIEGSGWFTQWSDGTIHIATPEEIEGAQQAGGGGGSQRDPRTPSKSGY